MAASLHCPPHARLELDAGKRLTPQRGTPVACSMARAFDFRTPRPIGALVLDDWLQRCLIGARMAVVARVRLADPATEARRPRLWMDASYPLRAGLFSGDQRFPGGAAARPPRGLAIEAN